LEGGEGDFFDGGGGFVGEEFGEVFNSHGCLVCFGLCCDDVLISVLELRIWLCHQVSLLAHGDGGSYIVMSYLSNSG
jgi:hypothetical protein